MEPTLSPGQIIINATHTAPVLAEEGEYWIPKEDVTQVEDYRKFFVDKITEGIVMAWNSQEEGSVAWGLSYAVADQQEMADLIAYIRNLE